MPEPRTVSAVFGLGFSGIIPAYVRNPPIRLATRPQACRLRKATPSSIESIAAPADAADAKYRPSPLTIMVGTNEPARSTEPARMVIFSIWAILF
jgi:hypothetical protein